jgi:hypothetical protein
VVRLTVQNSVLRLDFFVIEALLKVCSVYEYDCCDIDYNTDQ